MAYQSNLLGNFWTSYRQKRLGTGQALSQNEMGGLLGPMLEYDARRAEAQAAREQSQNQFNANLALQQKAQKDTKLASMVGGAGQLATLPLAYGAGKNLGWWGGAKGTPLPATQVPSVGAGNTNLLGASTAQGAVAPMAGITTAQGAVVPMANATPYAAAAPLSYGAGGEVGAGLGAGATTEAGLLSTAAPYAGPVGAGLLGSALGSNLALKYSPIGGEREKKIGGGIAGGAAAGAAMGSVVPGIGTAIGGVIGGVIGGISSLF